MPEDASFWRGLTTRLRTWWSQARALDPRVQISGGLALFWATAPGLISVVVVVNTKACAEWLQGFGDWGPLVAGGLFALTAGVGVIPTYAQSIVVGWAFGLKLGLLAAMSGCVGGAVIGFCIARAVTQNKVEALIDSKPKWRVVRHALAEAGFLRTAGIVALLRFSPSSPFSFSNLALAACGVAWLPMLIGTALGMLPRTALAVWAASLAASDDPSVMEFLSSKMGIAIGIGALLATLLLLNHIGERALKAAGLGAKDA